MIIDRQDSLSIVKSIRGLVVRTANDVASCPDYDDDVRTNLIGKAAMKPGANKHVNQDDKQTIDQVICRRICVSSYTITFCS